MTPRRRLGRWGLRVLSSPAVLRFEPEGAMGRHMRHARHIRRSKRTPSRMEQLARNMKRRGESAPEEESLPEPATEAVVPESAPYDPVTVPVRGLADALAEIDDADAVRAMRSADPRTSAERHYDARLEELDG